MCINISRGNHSDVGTRLQTRTSNELMACLDSHHSEEATLEKWSTDNPPSGASHHGTDPWRGRELKFCVIRT
jgi:hypothetical protein